MSSKIDPAKVEEAFVKCLYKDEETNGKVPEGAVLVNGITFNYGFHPGRLEEQREKVTAWLDALPHQFRESEGGGWSFLDACLDEDGFQWGEYRNMEQLFCLGIGLKLVSYSLPRSMWFTFSGGMPYYVYHDNPPA